VGANPPDKTPRFEQAVNYTEREGWKQTGKIAAKTGVLWMLLGARLAGGAGILPAMSAKREQRFG